VRAEHVGVRLISSMPVRTCHERQHASCDVVGAACGQLVHGSIERCDGHQRTEQGQYSDDGVAGHHVDRRPAWPVRSDRAGWSCGDCVRAIGLELGHVDAMSDEQARC